MVFLKTQLRTFSGIVFNRDLYIYRVCGLHTDRVCSLDRLSAAGWLTDTSCILGSDPELVLHVLLQACYYIGEPRDKARGHPLKAVAIFLNLLNDVALDWTAAVVVWCFPGNGYGLGCWIASLHLKWWVGFLCEVEQQTMNLCCREAPGDTADKPYMVLLHRQKTHV